MNKDEIFTHRKNKFLSIGRNQGFTSTAKNEQNLTMEESLKEKVMQKIYHFKFQIIFIFLLVFLLIYSFL